MLEDDQRFEELESKLAALSSQVESLELDTEVDPFFEDDVRRVIDDFKSRELAGLESEDEDFEDDESSSSDDFISVQTTGGPSFKTHWIAPTSCENMTRDLARDAFVQGAADRYGTSQQVNNGDVLILLCREAVAEEPEEGSEPAEPAAPKEICRYIGLAYNTLVHPASSEPTSETEELISAPVGNYEIFVWSSCECSGEPAETVVLPSIFEASSESSTNGNYASIGDAVSPDMSNADGLLTEASLRKSQDTSSSNLAKGLSNTLEKTDAGYKAQLVQLSQELSRYHLDQKKNQLNFEADKKNLNTHGFGSDLFVSKNLTLSNGECGNLETVSISGETFDLALLKEGDGTHDSTFLTTAKISLGTAVSIGGVFNLDVYDTNADDLDTDLELAEGSTVFLPVITETAADEIANADTLDTSTLALNTPVVTGDGENFTVSIGTQITTLTANYSSGLLTHKDIPFTAAGPTITFSIPDREVSLANLTSLGNAGPAGHYLKELSTIRATGEYNESGSLDLQVEFDALRSQLNFTDHGLFLNETSPESVTLSVGNISISPYTIDTFPDLGEERSDALISNISGFSSSIDSSHSNSGETKIDLTGSLQNTNYTFTKGLLTGATVSNASSVSLGSIIVPKAAEISLADLTSLGNSGPAGHYLKELSTIRATGEYNESGSLDLQVEFDALRSQLNFTDHGLFLDETSPEPVTLSVGNISISPYTIDTFPDLGEERSDALISNISGLSSSIDSSHSNSGETKIDLTGSLQNTNYTFTKGLLTGATVSNASSVSLGSIIVPKAAEISLADLTSLGNSGPAGHYLKELSTIRATGEYNESGSLDLQVEFDALRSQLNFTDHGLFLDETSPESVTLSVGNISISPYTIDTFPDLGEERSDALISNISGLSSSIDSSHSNSGETKIDLTGSLQNTNYTFNKGLLTGVSISNNNSVALGSIIVPKVTSQDPFTPSGTSADYTPELFKTSVNSGTASAFYEKSVSIFSSNDALINFTNGLAVSLSNPSYTRVTGLSLDASNNTGTAEATKLTDISVRGIYDVIYESEQTGDARYYIDYTYQDITLTIQNGLVTETVPGSSTTESKGPINVPGADLKYGCHPEYGCQPDPAGEFFDSSCGSGCPPTSELMLRYRPKNIWRYSEESRSSGTCYEELAHHELDPTQSTKTTQGYTNGGEFIAEFVGGEQVDNFYANGALIPFDDLYFAELPAEQLCYDLTFRPNSVEVYFKAHDPSQPDNFCLRLVSEHVKEAGDTTDQTQAYTNGGEMREVVSVGAGGVVTTKPIFYVDNIPRNPDAAGSSWVLGFEGVVPTEVAAICSEVSEINYSATGGQNTFSDTISYAETESPTKVSVSLQYNDMNNAAGSSYRFVDSNGAQLDPLESYVYAEGNDPLLFTLEIPQGSTGLDIYMNDQGLAGSSTWDLELTAQ